MSNDRVMGKTPRTDAVWNDPNTEEMPARLHELCLELEGELAAAKAHIAHFQKVWSEHAAVFTEAARLLATPCVVECAGALGPVQIDALGQAWSPEFRALAYEIEALPASEQQTKVITMFNDLHRRVAKRWAELGTAVHEIHAAVSPSGGRNGWIPAAALPPEHKGRQSESMLATDGKHIAVRYYDFVDDRWHAEPKDGWLWEVTHWRPFLPMPGVKSMERIELDRIMGIVRTKDGWHRFGFGCDEIHFVRDGKSLCGRWSYPDDVFQPHLAEASTCEECRCVFAERKS